MHRTGHILLLDHGFCVSKETRSSWLIFALNVSTLRITRSCYQKSVLSQPNSRKLSALCQCSCLGVNFCSPLAAPGPEKSKCCCRNMTRHQISQYGGKEVKSQVGSTIDPMDDFGIVLKGTASLHGSFPA